MSAMGFVYFHASVAALSAGLHLAAPVASFGRLGLLNGFWGGLGSERGGGVGLEGSRVEFPEIEQTVLEILAGELGGRPKGQEEREKHLGGSGGLGWLYTG